MDLDGAGIEPRNVEQRADHIIGGADRALDLFDQPAVLDIHDPAAQRADEHAEADAALGQLISLPGDAEHRAAALALQDGVRAFRMALDKSIALALNNQADAAATLSRTEGREARVSVVKLTKARADALAEELERSESNNFALGSGLLMRLYGFAGAGLAVSLALLAAIVIVTIVRPLAVITAGMQGLAAGDLEIHVQGADPRDEVGALSRSLVVFRTNALEARRLAVEQEGSAARIRDERKAALRDIATAFESDVGAIASRVASASTEMQGRCAVVDGDRRRGKSAGDFGICGDGAGEFQPPDGGGSIRTARGVDCRDRATGGALLRDRRGRR